MSTDEATCVRAVDPERSALGEDAMVGKARWVEVQRAYRQERLTISELARRFELDRKTVRRCLRQGAWRPYQRPPPPSTRSISVYTAV